MRNYPKFTQVLTVVGKTIAAIIITALALVLIGLLLLIRSCQAPLFDHKVEVYLRNKSKTPLQVSFVVPEREIVIDTVWERGGQESGDYVIGAYMAGRLRLQAHRFDWGMLYSGSVLIEGSAYTVFRSSRRTLDTAWFRPNDKRREVGIHPANPRFLALNDHVDGFQQPSDPSPPIKLERFKKDSVRLTLRIAPNGSLLVASKSSAFHASDPSYISMSDFALAPAHVEWVTSAGNTVHRALPARERLATLLKDAPDPETTKYFSCVDYIDYK